MKLAILGGGGFRVPLVYRALACDPTCGIDQVALFDTDPQRLATITSVLGQISAEHSGAPAISSTTDLSEAVTGADFVFCAIRVGGLAGRIADESVALALDVLGQETTGPGGLVYAMRTIPVMVDYARTVARVAPEAWFINFTNPAGIVTEALREVLGDRVIGICDSPLAMCRRAAFQLGLDPGHVYFDYFGLNHLGWLRAIWSDGVDRLPELFDRRLYDFEEGQLFGAEWLDALRMVPNEYLYYYYFDRDMRAAIRTSEATRGQYLAQSQTEFYRAASADPANSYRIWAQTLDDRNRTYMAEGREAAGADSRAEEDVAGGGYEGVALAIMRAIAADQRSIHILNVRNGSALPCLDADAVVEVPALVGSFGARPLAVGQVPDHAAGLLTTMKAVERLTIEAATTGSRSAALKAFALHPLVDSVTVAGQILDGYLTAHPGLGEILCGK